MTTTLREIKVRDAVSEALRAEMSRDDSVILMGEDVSGGAGRSDSGILEAWGGTFRTYKNLAKEFGVERVLDTPISEAAFIGAAIGGASVGLRPVAELMFADFIGVCLDQILNNAAKMRYMYGGRTKVPITIITYVGAGFSAAAQHSGCPYSILAHIPGLKVVAPSDPYTTKGLLIAAIRDDDPVIVAINKRSLGRSGPVPEEPYTVPLDKARVVQEGKDVTLVGISRMTEICLEAAKILQEETISVEVVDLLSLSPIDCDTILSSVRKTNRLVVVDEDWPRCSVASEVVAMVAEEALDYLDAPPAKVTAPHAPVPYSKPLEATYIPSVERVCTAVRTARQGGAR
jgi:pyruvate dehydrogenase E1 component beta subunit